MSREPSKYVRLPKWLPFPVQVETVHFVKGQTVSKGDPLYTLRDAEGKLGVMNAPLDAVIAEHPVEAGAAFSVPVPIVALQVLADKPASAASKTKPYDAGSRTPHQQNSNKTATSSSNRKSNSEGETVGHQATAKDRTAHKPVAETKAAPAQESERQAPTEQLEQLFRGRLTFTDKEAETLSLEEYRQCIAEQLAKSAPEIPKPLINETVQDWRLEANWHRAQAGEPFRGIGELVPPSNNQNRALPRIFAVLLCGISYFWLRYIGHDPLYLPDREAIAIFSAATAIMTVAVFLTLGRLSRMWFRLFTSSTVSAVLLFGLTQIPVAANIQRPEEGGANTTVEAHELGTAHMGDINPDLKLVELESLQSWFPPKPTPAEQAQFDRFLEEL